MTESEWHSCGDPALMFEHLRAGKLAAPRLRRYVIACCRRMWGASEDESIQVTLRIAERFVTGGIDRMLSNVVRVAGGEAKISCGSTEPLSPVQVWGEGGMMALVNPVDLPAALVGAIEDLACNGGTVRNIPWLTHMLYDVGLPRSEQADIFRDVVRAPFRPLTFRAMWRTCHDSAVLRVAEEIDRDGSFAQLPILADALMDAGCDCDELLEHLQGPAEHVRGCWGLDVVLGRF